MEWQTYDTKTSAGDLAPRRFVPCPPSNLPFRHDRHIALTVGQYSDFPQHPYVVAVYLDPSYGGTINTLLLEGFTTVLDALNRFQELVAGGPERFLLQEVL